MYKGNTIGGISLLNFKAYYVATVIEDNCMIFMARWTYRSLEENREARNRPPQKLPTDICKSNLMEGG